MDTNIQEMLNRLEEQVKSEDISGKAASTLDWAGADVIIKKSTNPELEEWALKGGLVLGFQNKAPKRRLVITKYSKELSWLFEQLKHVFSHKIDYASKYDFYGSLAESAINYLNTKEGDEDLRDLLLTVIATAKGLVL